MEPLYQHNSQPVVGQGSFQSSLTLPSSMVYYGSDYAQYTSGHGGPTYGNVHSNAIHNSAMHNNLALNGGSQIAGAPAGINGGNHLTQAAHLSHGEQPFYQNAYYSYTSPLGSVSSNSSAASIHQNNQAQSQGHAHLHAQGSQAQAQGPTSAPAASIDYSSLVSYTVLPRLKRKRRSNQAVLAAGTVTTSIAAVSTEPELFTCNVCDKVFHKQYNLKLHMKTHSDDKPFACSKCPKRFARSHDKKRHELLHEGVKNFKCQGYLKDGCSKWGCGKQFARSDALARHFRTETGWLCIKPLMDEAKKLDGGVGGAGAVNFGINLANASLANFGQGYDYEGGMALEDDFDSTLLRRMLPTTRM